MSEVRVALRWMVVVMALLAASPALAGTVLLMGTGEENPIIEAYLEYWGHTVTRHDLDDVPANLAPYDTVWVHTAFGALSATSLARLEAFVESGGGVYINGEYPGCCAQASANAEALVNATVTGAAAILVGGGGSVLGFGSPNAGAVNGITTTPFSPTHLSVAVGGGITGAASANQVVTLSGSVVVGAWRDSDMVGGQGRVVVVMDSNWPGTYDDWADEWAANFQAFLEGPDADGDGTPDASDFCTDTDGDGRGNPGFPMNTCQVDNCPTVANVLQLDLDSDGAGNVCDPCTDTDGDGWGNGGTDNGEALLIFGCSESTAVLDNCPTTPNPGQHNADAAFDGLGDVCDTCTDRDGDGWGDGGTNAVGQLLLVFGCDVADACEDTDEPCADIYDNCLVTPNPDQADTDSDGSGDLCDALFLDGFESGDASAWSVRSNDGGDPYP